MALNIDREVFNTYSVPGSNFQKGFKAGNFFLPNNLNPGVSVARVHQYQIANPLQAGTISTLEGTGAVSLYFPLNGVSEDIGEVVKYDSQNMGVKFDYPRQIQIECDKAFTATFNLIDRYMHKTVVTLEGITFGGNYFCDVTVAPLYLNSVLLTTPTGTTDFTATLSTNNFFELPYTDYDNKSFLQTVTGKISNPSVDTTGYPWMRTSLSNLSAPYLLEWDIEYASADWPTQTTETTSDYSRPFIQFTILGQPIDFSSTTKYTFTIGQTVFPTFTQEMAYLITPNLAESGVSTMGLKPVSTNWIGWRG